MKLFPTQKRSKIKLKKKEIARLSGSYQPSVLYANIISYFCTERFIGCTLHFDALYLLQKNFVLIKIQISRYQKFISLSFCFAMLSALGQIWLRQSAQVFLLVFTCPKLSKQIADSMFGY